MADTEDVAVPKKIKEAEAGVEYNAQGKQKRKYDKPKPWDTDDIEHWKIEPFDPSHNPSGMLEESSFATLFPQYRGRTDTYSEFFGRLYWRSVQAQF